MHTQFEYEPVARYMDRIAENVTRGSVITVRNQDDRHFYGLASGDRYRKHYEVGANKCLEHTADFLERADFNRLSLPERINEQKHALIQEYRQILYTLEEEYKLQAYEFSSGLVALSLDSRAGRFATANLGDSFIIGINRKELPT